MISKEDIKILSNIFLFWDKLEVDERAKIILSSRVYSLKKNSIFFETDELKGLLYLKSGCLRFFLSYPDGKEFTLYNLAEKELEISTSYMENYSSLSNIEFIAEENSEILIIPETVLENFSKKYFEIAKFLHSLTIEKFSKSLMTFQNVTLTPLKKRILDFLLSYEEKVIKITHEEIAKNLNTSREVVSRVLKKMEKENFLEVHRNKIILK